MKPHDSLIRSAVTAAVLALIPFQLPASPLGDEPVSWTDERRAEARETWEERIPGIIDDFRDWNEGFADGKAYSDRSDSAVLAWRQARVLHRYMQAFHITGDPYWLEIFVDQVDRMLDNRERHPPEDAPGWGSARGVAEVRGTPLGDRQKSILNPSLLRLRALSDEGRAVTGHTYEAVFDEHNRLVVTDLTESRVIEETDFESPHELTAVPGTKFLIEGDPVPGEGFRIETVVPRQLQSVLHDGMITYPIALFVEAALTAEAGSPAANYQDHARRYLEFLESDVFKKWEPYWNDLSADSGNYRYSDDRTERFPGFLLHHNRYMTLGRTWLALKDLPESEHGDVMEERVRKMTGYFKKHVRPNDNAWAWNFWDPGEGEELEVIRIEDMSHAAITASFLVQANYRSGAGVSRDDLRALSNTFVNVMWNGSLYRPRFAPYVARPPIHDFRSPTLESFKRGGEWHELARFDHRVWRLLEAAWKEDPDRNLALDLAYTYTRIVDPE